MSANAIREIPETSSDNLHSLERKIYRTIELLKEAREAKSSAERDLARVREQLETRTAELETLRSENVGLRREREEVRERVEKLLGQIESLEEE
jgi:chromosome segregation ATPase